MQKKKALAREEDEEGGGVPRERRMKRRGGGTVPRERRMRGKGTSREKDEGEGYLNPLNTSFICHEKSIRDHKLFPSVHTSFLMRLRIHGHVTYIKW